MTTPGRSDAIIIGAGIVGAACGAALARDGWRVTILDKSFASSGTTSVGMGHLVVMDDSPAQLALTAYSVRLWNELAGSMDRRAEYDRCGTLWLAEDESQLVAVRAKQQAYMSAGVHAEVLAPNELFEAEPSLRRDLVGALLVPEDSVLYPPGAALNLLGVAAARGKRHHGQDRRRAPHDCPLSVSGAQKRGRAGKPRGPS